MSRKSGKPPRDNPFLKKDRNQLLDELNSIQEMLGEAGEDVDDAGIPTLTTEGGAVPPEDKPPEGDAKNQIPLLAPDDASTDTPDEANKRLRKALKERENPFLSSAAHAADQRSAPAKAEPSSDMKPQTPAEPAPSGSGNPDEQQMRALVDEVLAAWLPKIERELRARLMEYLKDAGR